MTGIHNYRDYRAPLSYMAQLELASLSSTTAYVAISRYKGR